MTIDQLVSVVGGGTLGILLTAIVTAWIKRGERNMDEATAIRKELREQNAAILTRLDTVEAELDAWKLKYYALQQSYTTLLIEKEMLSQKAVSMQAEIGALQAQVKALQEAQKVTP
jgi:polyhydroxyalkanoate synthesis regulator phasin